MSKAISDDLFYLIKSLTKSEKRSFKLFASTTEVGKKSIYIDVFDAIEKQKKYDEKNIHFDFSSKSEA